MKQPHKRDHLLIRLYEKSAPLTHLCGCFICYNLLTMDQESSNPKGFGFDSTTGNYVVVWIVGVKHKDKHETYWEVYSSLTNSWTESMFDLAFYPHKGRNEVIVGGVPYWIGNLNDDSNLLLRYNVKEDRFEQIPLPELTIGQLVEWKSCFAIISVEEDKMTMTMYDEESRGWKTTLTLGSIALHINKPIQTFAYGQILVQTEEGVVLLDPQNNNRQVLCGGVLNSYAFQHIESMLHLDGTRGLEYRDGRWVFREWLEDVALKDI
ncbi:hypothetical protein DM860_007329 [Cuscuta australis]|uniref:F-box associated beta-propeller type 1 domain-containing protein n=1 Tax=Cuscuta australis TaxID=267555 RepID=A0A328E371_9ASTE|nr:hypothetical protein DM860_007329 [Cuscuta australis]